MVVKTQVSTRGRVRTRRGVVGYKDGGVRDLAPPSPAEPLNATVARKRDLSPRCNLEGRPTVARQPATGTARVQKKEAGMNMSIRVSVVSASGKPLMPCRSSKARKLLMRSLADRCWNKLGQFYLRLRFDPKSKPNRGQHVCLAVDTGSKWDGLAVLTPKGVLTTGMLVLPSGIAKKLEVRRQMRRARRYRNTPRRAKRSDNRRRPGGWFAPSQRAKVDFRTKIVDELCRLYPIDRFVVEDVRFNHYRKRWGKHFSTTEIGKAKFYEHLRSLGSLSLYEGVQTAEWRKKLGLPKNSRKSVLEWDAHAADAVAIGCAEMGCDNPTPPEFWVWTRFQNAKRQLHKLEPEKGGVRRREGGTSSIYPFKKADVVMWRRVLARVGGYKDGRISLHTFTLENRRITQSARVDDCVRLFNQRVFSMRKMPQFPATLNDGASLQRVR